MRNGPVCAALWRRLVRLPGRSELTVRRFVDLGRTESMLCPRSAW